MSSSIEKKIDVDNDAVDYLEQTTENVRISSRGLGWSVIEFQRRDSPPASRELPKGSGRHLLFVCLSGGRIVRESQGERVELEVAPGAVTFLPSGTPIRWTWKARISCSIIALDPAFVNRVGEQVFGLKS